MARYEATVSSSRPAEEVFDYLADFANAKDWDPSITTAEQLDDGPALRPGARFKVVTSVAGLDTELEYETTDIERPSRIVLRGTTSSMVSIDTITVSPTADGCEVTYLAEIELKGVRKIADPAFQLGFNRLGDRARDGLAEKLSQPLT